MKMTDLWEDTQEADNKSCLGRVNSLAGVGVRFFTVFHSFVFEPMNVLAI